MQTPPREPLAGSLPSPSSSRPLASPQAPTAAAPLVFTVRSPCGRNGGCPFAHLGPVLLAPPSLLQQSQPTSKSGHHRPLPTSPAPRQQPKQRLQYHNGVRLTPILPEQGQDHEENKEEEAAPVALIARLLPLAESPGCDCHAPASKGPAAVAILPRGVLVSSSSSSSSGGAWDPASLPAQFEARMAPLTSSASVTGRGPSAGLPVAASVTLTPRGGGGGNGSQPDTRTQAAASGPPAPPPSILRALLLHAVAAPGATVHVLAASGGAAESSSSSSYASYDVARCVPSQAAFLSVTRNTRLTLAPPPPPATEAEATAAAAGSSGRSTQAASSAAGGGGDAGSGGSGQRRQRLSDGLLELIAGVAAGRNDRLSWLVPRGVLLSGPPGVGKTFAVREAVQRATEEMGIRVHTQVLNGGEAMAEEGGSLGGVEARIRGVFAGAHAAVEAGRADVAVLFLDEMEALCPAPSDAASTGAKSRVPAQLGQCLDAAAGRRLLVFGATNRPHDIHPSLRRPGRLDKEIMVPPPAWEERLAMLAGLLHLGPSPANNQGEGSSSSESGHPSWLASVARDCAGYVAADLAALVKEALAEALVERTATAAAGVAAKANAAGGGVEGGMGAPSVVLPGERHFRAAMERVGASVLRGRGLEVPKVPWAAIGGQEEAKRRLQQALEWPLKYPQTMTRFFSSGSPRPEDEAEGSSSSSSSSLMGATGRGILLYGPPGCAKTTLVKAAVTAIPGVSFLSLSSGDVYSVYVGDAEAAIRSAFALARQASPCVLFFDELDAIVGGGRQGIGGHGHGGDGGGGGGSSNSAEARVLSTFLNELDGVDAPAGGDGVLVVGATNLPEALDPALLRPGRLSHVIPVLPPRTAEERRAILGIHTAKMPLQGRASSAHPDGGDENDPVDLGQVAARTAGFSGADLEGLCREAAMAALRDDCPAIGGRHFEAALALVAPSLDPGAAEAQEGGEEGSSVFAMA